MAAEYTTNPAAIALAWLIARPGITAPIASATNKQQLGELEKATRLQLKPESINLLDKASAY